MAILIVDDDPHLGGLLSLRLGAEGYQTCTARSAEEVFVLLGLEAGVAADPPVKLVILDVFLPDMSGIEACRRIKADVRTADLPVIMVTGSTEEEHLRQAFEAGATDYIEKPFKGVEVVARIRAALRLRREIEERKRHAQALEQLAEQLRRANERLQALSFQDALTGLYNRRYFDDFLEREFRRAVRNQGVLALSMIDVDHFKAYNDRFGHQAGDDCLRRVAAALTLVIHRSSDLIARYGGEEFAAVLPETLLDGALEVAEKLRARVAALQLPHPDSPCGIVTISAGVAACRPEPGDHPESLIEAADAALYHAKRAGRNRVSAAA
ncbi:two-component system, chemotaxis family, response regulator WspR [Methylomarinovum caldicuralii]|uniref:diguanylate cyclase n=1 Tax=Methylomarinovum caldicuralii TaxID=438856 RepID=A0AAU9BV72_9GAMM|nr:diguanylate cyclase [Methylomarinovum caldicuralii]BCX82878.1 two-component system, chemotaxis family, response regulator WspR [Methylomarinovum caldicuralii]